MNDNFRYKDEYWQIYDAKEIIFNKIESNKSVLDLGCWTGRLGEKLTLVKKCSVTGVDINQKALIIASKRLKKTIKADLNYPQMLLKKINQKYDFIILADVLEHLQDSKEVLIIAKKLLKENGRVMISIPNIAYWTIRLKLIFGKFDYEKTGIMDETHLRFFTRKTAEELIKNSGFYVEKFYFTGRQFFPSLNAFQFVFICKTNTG